jgi:hypothetical protein
MAPAGGWINGEWDSVAEVAYASAWYNRPRLHQPTTDTVLSVPPHLCWTHLATDPNGMCGSTQLLNNWPSCLLPHAMADAACWHDMCLHALRHTLLTKNGN